MWWIAAAAATCGEVGPSLDRAEEDLLGFYLADAQKGLDAALEGWGCAIAKPADLARYYRLQGMIWTFQEDPERARRAFSASKCCGEHPFEEAFGADAAEVWAKAEANAETVSFRLRGAGDGERTWVNGEPSEVAPLGLSIVQVGLDTPRAAKAVSLNAADANITMPELGATSVLPPPPRSAKTWAEIRRASKLTPEGKKLAVKGTLGTVLQVAGGVLVAGGGYGAYLFGWEATTGRGTDASVPAAGLTASAVAIAGGGTLVALPFLNKKKRRAAIRAAAERSP